MSKSIIITGATGKQGGALLTSLLSKPTSSNPFKIYALTRNPTSPSALRLTQSRPTVTFIQGDFSDPPSIFTQVPHPHTLFLMSNPLSATREEAQGKAMVTAARAAGIKHIIFTATDRGVHGDNDGTLVPHFASKFHIEREIMKYEGQWKWTFLRPVAFMENLGDGFLGKAFAGMWRLNKGVNEGRLKVVSTGDIGKIAAEVVLEGGEGRYGNRAVDVVGDEISFEEARRVFREVTGREMPETYGVVARLLKIVAKEQVGVMFDWFKSDGFGADLDKMRREYPFVKDFRTWLETESAWKKR